MTKGLAITITSLGKVLFNGSNEKKLIGFYEMIMKLGRAIPITLYLRDILVLAPLLNNLVNLTKTVFLYIKLL